MASFIQSHVVPKRIVFYFQKNALCHFSLGILFFFGVCLAQDDGLDGAAYTCSLSVKAKVFAPDFGETQGRALITATLCTTDGVPLTNKEINMTVTSGMFSCLPPDSFSTAELCSADRSCFITDMEGKMQVYVAHVPINKPGIVKASYPFGNGVVRTSCTFAITKRIVKKKRPDPSYAASSPN
jgi:hypothetical protein